MNQWGGMTAAMMMMAALFLSACGGSNEPRLMNVTANRSGPDEFAILPNKPLQMPGDYSALPEPTPGGRNLVDPTPRDDAVATLGGRPGTGVPGDAALVAHAARHGIAPGIRQTLGAEDLEYRRRNNGRLLERLFNVNVYFRAYEKQSLDQYRELRRWRRHGVRTPAAPPDPELLP